LRKLIEKARWKKKAGVPSLLVFCIIDRKGVSMMSEKRSLITLSNEQTIAWYQAHVQVMHGYALALALKAGLSAAEAARVFVEPWHAGHANLPSQATVEALERQARQIAEVLALTHGEEQVQVEHQDDATWRVGVTIVDPEPFERYGVSLEMHTQWVAEQLRLVCEPKGIVCSVRLDQDRQNIQLSLLKEK
jgi:hypothetical protein